MKELNDLNVKELVNLKNQITNCQQDDPLSTSNRMTGVLANQLVRRRSDAHTKVCEADALLNRYLPAEEVYKKLLRSFGAFVGHIFV